MLLLAALIYSLLALLGTSPITQQGAEADIALMGQHYLNIMAQGSLVVLGSTALPILMRNDHSPNLATLLMILGALANILLDYLLIVYFNWGLAGAAYATLGAQTLVMTLALAYFLSDFSELHFQWRGFVLQPRELVGIANLGFSSFLTALYTAFITVVHNWLFLRYGTVTETGAYAIVLYLSVIYYFIAEGFANGMQPLLSYNYGAQRYHNLLKVMALGFGIILGTGGLAVLLMNLFSELSVGIFNKDDPALRQATVAGIRLHLWAMPLDGLIFTSAMVFQALNQAHRASLISLGNMLIQLPFMLLLPASFGVTGVWLIMPLSTALLSLPVAYSLYRLLRRFRQAA